MADIFLSYAREDIKKAEVLANALESQGWTVFWDSTSLLAGQDFEAVIEQAIKKAGCMVVAWSEASRQSAWVRGEAGIARERNILVPILFEPVEPPIAFRSLHTENLTDWDGGTDAPDFLKLCKAINERMSFKTAPSTNPIPSYTASNKTLDSAKTNFLKRYSRAVWDWLSVTKHQQTLAFIGGVLSIVITGGWQAYLHFSMKPTEASSKISVSGNATTITGTVTATATNGGNATNIVGNNNTVGDPNASGNIKEIVATLTSKHQLDSQAKNEQIKALTEAVTTLSKGQNILGTKAQVDEALQALAKNDTTQAKALFAKAAQKADQEAKEGAKTYRNLGALAYLDNTEEALLAYRRSTELDPDNVVGWNYLGLLLERVGDLDESITAYSKAQGLVSHLYSNGVSPANKANTADIAKIYNIEKAPNQKVDVRYYRKGECDNSKWCLINGEGEYLKAQDFLQTGDVSRADLALMFNANQYSDVLFWQQEGSRSKFDPKEGTCHFKVDVGGFLYAHPHQSINPGCQKIVSNNALVFPNGTALFIEANEKETMVGALSNRPGGLIKVEHSVSHESASIKAGEYAKALQNGKIVTGFFSLEDFYRNKALGLGLGPDDKDENYVKQQAPDVQVILNKLRAETLAAVDDQKKMIADGKLPDFGRPMDPKGGGTGSTTGPASPPAGATAGIGTNSGGTPAPATSTLITPSLYLNPNIKVFVPPPPGPVIK